MIYKNILETVGKTPVVGLGKLSANLYAKVESFNPGGSVKDRIALAMIEDAEKNGRLKPGMKIIEPTSGNTGIGLAMVAAVKGYRAAFAMPETMSMERRKLLKQYGAEIIITEGSKGMNGAVEKAEALVRTGNYFMPQQFKNPANPEIHEKTTAKEIIGDFKGLKLDYFVAGVGTGGTISGTGKILKKHFPDIKIIAVEPEESPLLSGGKAGPHKIQGIGANFIPETYNAEVVDEVIKVNYKNALETSRRLAREEGILAGISAGANIYAALQKAQIGATLAIIPDTGERYISTELFGDENV
ncbi:cysteine synthase A [Candidatus Woesearchaeota archaeon]|nr:cysteine synthase A [Candidatus Woesearchaeota archaeon]